jgi:hypothetical protein
MCNRSPDHRGDGEMAIANRHRCKTGQTAAVRFPTFLLFPALVVFLSATASASPRQSLLQVKVLSAESHQFEGPPLDPPNCNWKDISAYCYGSGPETYVENTMIVQEPDGKSLEIACTVYNQWSHCADLPVNQTFQATMGKHGLEIRYLDQHHKMRNQLYEILRESQ